MPTFSRKLGDSELSYFLPSRADGVNDMYLHLGFRAPQSLVNPHRVALAWAILRVRHPLLAASVVMEPGEYNSAQFVYTPPTSPVSALLAAQSTLLLHNAPKDSLINAYLNGPRTLSDDRVSVLMLSSLEPGFPQDNEMGVVTPPQTPRHTTAEFDLTSTQADNSDKMCEFDLLFCATHFLGDGIALHTCVNDLFTLLAGPVLFAPADSHLQPGSDSQISEAKSTAISGLNISGAASPSLSPCSGHSARTNPETFASGNSTALGDKALNTLLEVEWSNRWGSSASASSPFSDSASSPNVEFISPLPPSLESRLPGPSASNSLPPSPLATFQRVAHDLAFRRSQGRLIGGHSFTRVHASIPHFESDSSDTNQAKNTLPTSVGPLTSKSIKIPRRQCHTLVRTVAFPPALTQRVLKRCKEEGVSVAHVLFALSNVAWGRVGGRGNGSGWEMPMMMYSALNLRPYLTPAPAPSLSLRGGDASYWFLAVGYFNVVLPAFLLPRDGDDASDTSARKTLFHRARISKRQCASAAKTPFLAPYAQRMARERGDRARKFARADDELDTLSKGTSGGQTARFSESQDFPALEPAQMLPSPPTTPVSTRPSTPPLSTTTQNDTPSLPERLFESLPKILPSNKETLNSPLSETFPSKVTVPLTTTLSLKPPSAALLGLSLLGNLDTMYSHSTYSLITLHTLTTGSRQRAGALLLFGYTFAGRLWVSLGWDGGAFGGEGGVQEQGEGKHCDRRDIVWEGLERERTSDGQIRERVGDGCVSGMGLVGCEGELGRWWREVVKGVGEFFGED